MEFLYTQTRSNEPSLSQHSSDSATRKNVGLLVFYGKPLEESRIVFNTRNLTKTLFKTNVMLPEIGDSKGKSVVGECQSPSIKPCLLSPNYIPSSFICGSDQESELSIRVGSSSLEPNRIDISLNSLPLTRCTKHGTAGFLPLDYVRKLPEYTCTTHKYPLFKVVHSFEECKLEFPRTQPIGSSRQHFQDGDYMKNCYQCRKKLSKRKNIYMYRDNLFCCPDCRYGACVTHYCYKKMMKAAENNNGGSSPESSNMDGDTIFSIE